MLILTRKPGEYIHVGESIVVRVLEVCGNKVRLGFEAPSDVRILRGELPHFPSTLSSGNVAVAVTSHG